MTKAISEEPEEDISLEKVAVQDKIRCPRCQKEFISASKVQQPGKTICPDCAVEVYEELSKNKI